MDPEARADEAWDRTERRETPTERLDRNWADLLQELRVVQTGVQLLTGFLLTLPFQQRFTAVPGRDRVLYLVAVGLSTLATALLIAPVSMHRMVFRRHARGPLVRTAHRCALAGLGVLGLAVVAVVTLIFDVTYGRTSGAWGGAVAGGVFLALWLVVPLAVRGSARAPVRDRADRARDRPPEAP